MNDVLFVAACFAGAFLVALLCLLYIEWQDRREAAAARDALGVWHDSTSGDLIDAIYQSEQGIEETRTETKP
jgi:hypothetical protein